eukprot:3577211-Amphidinium_carterae.1
MLGTKAWEWTQSDGNQAMETFHSAHKEVDNLIKGNEHVLAMVTEGSCMSKRFSSQSLIEMVQTHSATFEEWFSDAKKAVSRLETLHKAYQV